MGGALVPLINTMDQKLYREFTQNYYLKNKLGLWRTWLSWTMSLLRRSSIKTASLPCRRCDSIGSG